MVAMMRHWYILLQIPLVHWTAFLNELVGNNNVTLKPYKGDAARAGFDCPQHGQCGSCVRDGCGWCKSESRCMRLNASCGSGHEQTIGQPGDCPPVAPRETLFSREEAREMGRYASASYYDFPDQHGLPPAAQVVKTFHFQLGLWDSAFGFIALDRQANRIVLAFRGTETLTQVSVELLFHNLVPFHGDKQVRVNEFFFRAANDLLPQLSPVLQDLESNCSRCQLWVTGHSLGASMALLAAYNVSFWTRHAPVLYTFGQPRSVNGAFARMVEERIPRIYRLVNAADPVPHIPLCTRGKLQIVGKMTGCLDDKPGGYHHVGMELWFPYGDYINGIMCDYRECVGIPKGEDLTCADGLSFPHDVNVLDHHGYWRVLEHGFCGVAQASQAILV